MKSIIEYINKSIYFRDVYIFIDRIKNIVYIKRDTLLR